MFSVFEWLQYFNDEWKCVEDDPHTGDRYPYIRLKSETTENFHNFMTSHRRLIIQLPTDKLNVYKAVVWQILAQDLG